MMQLILAIRFLGLAISFMIMSMAAMFLFYLAVMVIWGTLIERKKSRAPKGEKRYGI